MDAVDKWFDDFFAEAKNSKEYKQERAANLRRRVTRAIKEKLKSLDMKGTILAKQMGCSTANVAKMLRGDNNFTLDLLNEIADALNARLDIVFADRMTCDLEYKSFDFDHGTHDKDLVYSYSSTFSKNDSISGTGKPVNFHVLPAMFEKEENAPAA